MDSHLVREQSVGVDAAAVDGHTRAGLRQHAGLDVAEHRGQFGVGSFTTAGVCSDLDPGDGLVAIHGAAHGPVQGVLERSRKGAGVLRSAQHNRVRSGQQVAQSGDGCGQRVAVEIGVEVG